MERARVRQGKDVIDTNPLLRQEEEESSKFPS